MSCASPVLDFRELPELDVCSISLRGQEFVAGAMGLAQSLELLDQLHAMRGSLPLQVFHLAACVSNLRGLLDEVGPELDPASHLARRKRSDRQALPDGRPFTVELIAAEADSLLLGRQKFQPVPGLVQAGLGRCLLRDTLDLAA